MAKNKTKKKENGTIHVKLGENATLFSDPKTGLVIRNEEVKEIPAAWNKPPVTKDGKAIRNKIYAAIKGGHLIVINKDEAEEAMEEAEESQKRKEALYRHKAFKISNFKNKDSLMDYIRDNYPHNFKETDTWDELGKKLKDVGEDGEEVKLSDLTKKQLTDLAKDCHDNLPIPNLDDVDDDEDDDDE